MAKIIDTSLLIQKGSQWTYEGVTISSDTQYQVYNGLDCCVTLEVFDVLRKQLREQNTPNASLIYDFERGLQAPALDMMMRGFLTDAYERKKFLEKLSSDLTKVQSTLNKFAYAVAKFPELNPNSPTQLKAFFYGALALPEQFRNDKGTRKVTTNREALEKLLSYFIAIPIINCIFSCRELRKKISVLSSQVSPDGRMRSSWSPASTETGRWTSSKDALGDGTNLQNITPELRKIFIADPGKKLLHVDQEQAESRVVGLLLWAFCNDRRYLGACESGDLHTNVAKLLWPHITDKNSAEQIFYRHFSYRDMSKRGGHLTNYRGSPWVMAQHLKLPIKLCEEFQDSYYAAFGHDKWHTYVATQLQLHQQLETPLGHKRTFFGNPYDDAVLREAIAYVPQSTVAQLTGLIIWKVWKEIRDLELLTNDHDGVTWQFPDNNGIEQGLIERVSSASRISITINDKSIVIPLEFSSGWNWASAEKPPFLTQKMIEAGIPTSNPDGLKKWRGEDKRVRSNNLQRVL